MYREKFNHLKGLDLLELFQKKLVNFNISRHFPPTGNNVFFMVWVDLGMGLKSLLPASAAAAPEIYISPSHWSNKRRRTFSSDRLEPPDPFVETFRKQITSCGPRRVGLILRGVFLDGVVVVGW